MSLLPKDPLPPLRQDPHARRLLIIIGYMIVIAGAAYALSAMWPVIDTLITILTPFLVAFVVAYLFNPIVNFVQRRLRLSRVMGVLFVNVLIILILGIFIGIIVPILYTQTVRAYREIRGAVTTHVLPRIADELNLPIYQAEPTQGEYLEFLQDWKGKQARRATTEEQRLQLDRLQSDIQIWIAAEGQESGATVVLDQLDEIIAEWARDYQSTGPPELTKLPVEILRERTKEWIAARKAWLAGEPRSMQFQDFWKQIDLWLNEKGIYLEQIGREALAGGQVSSAATQGANIVGAVFVALGRAIGSLVTSVIFLVFVFLVSFYLLIDFAKLRGVVEVMMPDQYEARFFDVLHKIDAAVGGFIRGQILVATIVGLLATIGLWFLGLKQYAVLIGIITGIGNLIPYLGPIMGATPAVFFILLSKSFEGLEQRLIHLLMLLGLFAAIQFIEGFILQPKVVGKSAQLHPVIVILALVLGSPFGIMGMIIALPLAAATRVLLKEFYWDRREHHWRETTGKVRLDDVLVDGKMISKKKIRGRGNKQKNPK